MVIRTRPVTWPALWLAAVLLVALLSSWNPHVGVVWAAKKSAQSVAVPRKKGTKGVTPFASSPFGGLLQRAFREIKTSFCSELEALTLQLTRPTDAPVPLKSLAELVRCLDTEYENPQFTVSLLAKFSRKLFEPNVYTKLKAMVCLHNLMQELEGGAQSAVMLSVRSLRSETDEKVGATFFAPESIEQAADVAVTVAELESVEYVDFGGKRERERETENIPALLTPTPISTTSCRLCREYAAYVLEFVDLRGDAQKVASRGKGKGKGASKTEVDATANEDRAEALLRLAELSEVRARRHRVQSLSSSFTPPPHHALQAVRHCGGGEGNNDAGSNRRRSQLATQCLTGVLDDRPWIVQQMKKLYEVRAWSFVERVPLPPFCCGLIGGWLTFLVVIPTAVWHSQCGTHR